MENSLEGEGDKAGGWKDIFMIYIAAGAVF